VRVDEVQYNPIVQGLSGLSLMRGFGDTRVPEGRASFARPGSVFARPAVVSVMVGLNKACLLCSVSPKRAVSSLCKMMGRLL
jgi:hypothetical protein